MLLAILTIALLATIATVAMGHGNPGMAKLAPASYRYRASSSRVPFMIRRAD